MHLQIWCTRKQLTRQYSTTKNSHCPKLHKYSVVPMQAKLSEPHAPVSVNTVLTIWKINNSPNCYLFSWIFFKKLLLWHKIIYNHIWFHWYIPKTLDIDKTHLLDRSTTVCVSSKNWHLMWNWNCLIPIVAVCMAVNSGHLVIEEFVVIRRMTVRHILCWLPGTHSICCHCLTNLCLSFLMFVTDLLVLLCPVLNQNLRLFVR